MSQLYFEDVKVDDEIPPVEKLPTEDMAVEFFGRDNPTNPAFADAEAGRRMGVATLHQDVQAIVSGEHADPFRVLGMHRVWLSGEMRVVVRASLPHLNPSRAGHR